MASEWIYIAQPTCKLDQRIMHFPRDSNFSRWDHVYGRLKPKNMRTFNAYRRRLWSPPPVPKKQPSPWLNLVPKCLQNMPTWPANQVQAQPLEKHHATEPADEDFMMSGALPVEKIARDFKSTPEGSEGGSEHTYEEILTIWAVC